MQQKVLVAVDCHHDHYLGEAVVDVSSGEPVVVVPSNCGYDCMQRGDVLTVRDGNYTFQV
jgi:hypothetical protein